MDKSIIIERINELCKESGLTHDMLTSDREVASFATTYGIYQKRYANK